MLKPTFRHFYISSSFTLLPVKIKISNTGYSVNMCGLNILIMTEHMASWLIVTVSQLSASI